jgi:hypothetical protein
MLTDTGLIIIHDKNYKQFVNPTVDGETKKCGTIPRNLMSHPIGCYPKIRAVDFPVYPQSEWSDRLKQQTADGRRCSDIRNRGLAGQPLPSRDQNGRGYCWQFSGVSALMIVRARDGQPYADLSAYGPACREKNYRDEGGWGAQGVQNLIEWGCPTSKTWPQQATSRSHDKPETWAEAALYKVDEGMFDLQAAEYDRNLTWQQYVTSWLNCWPTVNDYNWWGHSVCGMDLVEGAQLYNWGVRQSSGKKAPVGAFEKVWDMAHPVTAGNGCLIWNSWGNSWSQNGAGVLAPSKAVPDGGVAVCTGSASAA